MHVGTAYAIWMGIAVTGTTLTSVLVYKEPTSWIRVAFVGLIVFGIVGLQLTSPQKP
ncbi:SMR family transporter [bacterium]|nr:SMR family transporter [bacterium]